MTLDMSDDQTLGEASFESPELMPEIRMASVRERVCSPGTQDNVHAVGDDFQRLGRVRQFQCRNRRKELTSADRLFCPWQRATFSHQGGQALDLPLQLRLPNQHDASAYLWCVFLPRHKCTAHRSV